MLLTVTPYPYGKYLLASGLVVWEAEQVQTMVAYHASIAGFDTSGGSEFQVTTTVRNGWDSLAVNGRSVKYNPTTKKTEICAAALAVKPKSSAIVSGSAVGIVYAYRTINNGFLIFPLAKLSLASDGASSVTADTIYVTRPAGGVLLTL